ncbi:MAG: acetyl-CoA C-acyltransferase, partial [Pseudomonadota bacterium]|nr:acetyl-CoA C-acyltransferase [Pseudomonadota bacterium]
MDSIVIAAAVRTPIGAFQGALSGASAAELGAAAIRAVVARARVAPQQVDEVLMGCVLQAGQGQAPARQAALLAGLPASACCTTVHKVCGSAMQAVMLAHDGILAGSYALAVAGGMESMSKAPYLLPKARSGMRLGHGQVLDHMFLDGLEDAYAPDTRGRLMGTFAEDCASEYGFTRAAQDAYAIRSTQRAQQAGSDGSFDWELAPVEVASRKGVTRVERDEGPLAVDIARIPGLKPAFREGGTVTAANASSIADGAAALLLMRASHAASLGLRPLARIVGHATHAGTPARFPVAPV